VEELDKAQSEIKENVTDGENIEEDELKERKARSSTR
jgi:hypothetical protein